VGLETPNRLGKDEKLYHQKPFAEAPDASSGSRRLKKSIKKLIYGVGGKEGKDNRVPTGDERQTVLGPKKKLHEGDQILEGGKGKSVEMVIL